MKKYFTGFFYFNFAFNGLYNQMPNAIPLSSPRILNSNLTSTSFIYNKRREI